jgi:YidC/Oxa1 family membrane protein insertase
MDSRLTTLLLVIALGLGAYFMFFRDSGSSHPQDHVIAPDDVRPASAAARGAEEQILYAHSGGLAMRVSTYSGASPDMYLTSAQFLDPRTHQPMRISTTNPDNEPFYALRSDIAFERNGQNVLPPYLTYTVEHNAPDYIELVARPEGTDVEVRRTIRPHTDYAFRVRTRVVNHGAPGRLRFSQGTFQWVKRSDESGGMFRQSWQLTEGLCYDAQGDKLLRERRENLAKRTPQNDAFFRSSRFVGIGNLYFLSALIPQGDEAAACHMRAIDRYRGSEVSGSIYSGFLSWHPVQLAQEEAHEYAIVGYFGPKLRPSLAAVSPYLDSAVNLGFFAIIARGLLKLLTLLHTFTTNWGIAIILLTLVVRTALFPITARSMKSMAAMQKLKPEIDALNERYKDNQEQKGLATMELYRKHKINPVAGCLPQLAQLPIWWALYTTLQTSVELFHAPFMLWWRDLSAPDPFFVLPIVLGGTMFLQQKLMPASMPDPAQQKMMMYFMPIFMTGISLFLPAGLALYMLVNSVLAMLQQRITKAQIDRMALATPQGSIEVRRLTDETLPSGERPSKGGGSSSSGSKNGGRRGGRR